MKGNKDYLLQLLFILIENGFKYTPSGKVRLYASRSGNHVGLTVSDTGIGLAAEDLPHIFDRFYRADQSRGRRPVRVSPIHCEVDRRHAQGKAGSKIANGRRHLLYSMASDFEPRTVDFAQSGEYGIMEPSERPDFSNSESREDQD
ncbi:ATP-binding protein [Cohnella faecalis]|uniref:ATP-binding protein n=1 Tax=Cohnella faecalis TaxID=2315694 RepID=UPI0013148DEF|nr:sensor histidine kinase [Cohnella faecalis]